MLRLLFRLVLLVVVLGAIAVFALGYRLWPGGQVRETIVDATSGIDTTEVRRTGSEIAGTVAAGAGRAGEALSEARITAKIKSKMTLDDTIDASRIDVDTAGTVVTVSGAVATSAEHQRALQLARETAEVTSVVDRLEVARRD